MHPITAYLCLFAAIIFEVCGTLLLPASQNFTNLKATLSLMLFYGISFYFLSIVVNFIPIAIMYATWSGLGIFTLALVSYFAFNQTLNFLSLIGLALIVIGVIIVNINLTLPK
jgi:small multidrug resistance pump